MKCDELKRKYSDITGPYYGCNEVDEAIDELKKKLMPCLNGDCILTCEVVEKYGKENAELKNKLDDAQAKVYADSIDAWKRERSLRRALWLARAYSAYMNKLYINADWYSGCEKDFDFWTNTEKYCRDKAEEYK